MWPGRRFFANVQQLLERAILGGADNGTAPALIAATFKPFPWPAVQIDLGAPPKLLQFR